MRRFAPLALLVLTTAARADRMPDFSPEVRAAVAGVTVIGTVTEIEKELVQAKPYPGATDPVAYTVAVVKVETNVHGAKNVTHVRVGFILPPAGLLPRYPQPTLKADQKVCLFLNKHPDGGFHVFAPLSPPVENSDANKAVLDAVKKLAPVFADPLAALTADKAEDRAHAATWLLTRYRQSRYAGLTAEEAIPADESKALLAALAESSGLPAGVQLLNLTKADGYNPPQPKPGEDAAVLMRDEFKRWAANEGAKYAVKKLVPKAR